MQLVLDTNIVLDLFVFSDERVKPLAAGLEQGALRWLATAAMREELARVLAYPKLAPKVGDADAVLAAFDRHAQLHEVPAKAPVTCGDPDDQKFIDLAVAHRCALVSKDGEVLRMKKRLAKLDVVATPIWGS
ncbi:PIN domain-containing protein [Ramlibacter sp. G-1-2-2]|uniref:PIN domain-containing protein n=1 Tax=Ramlibacter agri TaxID=2728837 RepID=A0A848GZB5_9BURK|nr:PIN domain-containing protein [Ramlibacter agri]NML42140.1 PIN domain-containing protein [Ramlibacter agri]